MLSLLLTELFNRDKSKLLEKNRKMQDEILELAKAADKAFYKELERRQHAIEGDLQGKNDDRLHRKMKEIRRQQDEIERFKYEIVVLKRQLENILELYR